MKKITIVYVISCIALLCGCERSGVQIADGVVVVDLSGKYSKQKLFIQDFMDVEYVSLETSDEFVNQGFVQDIGKDIILVKNRNDDGDIFVYDRSGKALRRFNHKGQAPEEYISITNISLDNDRGEIFVNDHFSQKIVVYDLYGTFKRYFRYKENKEDFFYTQIFNYDSNNLICYDQYNGEKTFVLISKQDGRITHEVKIPFKEKKYLRATLVDEAKDSEFTVTPGPYPSISPFKGNWMLLELSSDTVYTFLPDSSIRPFFVRTPSIQSMKPEVFLIIRLFTARYYFMESITNTYNFDTKNGFYRTFFMYDKQKSSFFSYNIYNSDYLIKKEIYMNVLRPVNYEIAAWQPLEASELIGSYKKGELKGKLKDITALLDEESNPVIMLIKHKK